MRSERLLILWFYALLLAFQAPVWAASAKGSEATQATADLKAAGPTDLDRIARFDRVLSQAAYIKAGVSRTNRLTLLGETRQADGELLLSKGKVRLDLTESATNSRDLLILGERKFWAVHYPPKELIGATIQVIQGRFERTTKTTQSREKLPKKRPSTAQAGLLALFGTGGLLKSFTVTGVKVEKPGTFRYYLLPATDWIEAKRATVEFEENAKTFKLLKVVIWDFQDNESEYNLKDFEAVAKSKIGSLSGQQLAQEFEFSIPKGADVMSAD